MSHQPPLLTIVEGTTYAFALDWTQPDGTPVDLAGCHGRFVIAPASESTPLVDCSTDNDAITLEPAAGRIAIRIAPEMTAGRYSRDWVGARYELRLTFPGGDVYSLLQGPIRLTPGVIDG
ncbi:hypothetical protein [Halomonas organivorans]|uniref:Uncharacterized protein n=1 Tax=Halomonas organivorans TaxID=257772 RepID=A0A7W5G5L5_9GAMM|nr:hypothetical protein [Halomonas organivorans]MBB3141215.1 hypothetical protein [Halomonas organivorans]